eukprot:6970372-Alexandrium_andersonii.AAC.1
MLQSDATVPLERAAVGEARQDGAGLERAREQLRAAALANATGGRALATERCHTRRCRHCCIAGCGRPGASKRRRREACC